MKIYKRDFFILFFIVCAFILSPYIYPLIYPLSNPQLCLRNVIDKQLNLSLTTACSTKSRAKGLQNVNSLNENSGMLFVFPRESYLKFWMKDTKIPLDIAFLDKNKKVIYITNMKPDDTTEIKSPFPAQYAIEVNAGYFQKHNIQTGYIFNFSSNGK